MAGHEYTVGTDGIVGAVSPVPAPLARAKERFAEEQRAQREAAYAARRAAFGAPIEVIEQIMLPANRLRRELPPYQRSLNEDKALNIACTFEPALFTPVIAARAVEFPGDYYELDGQHHRYAAQLVRGEDVLVPVLVVQAETWQERARLFDLLNSNRTAVKFTHRFMVRVGWGEQEAVEIEAAAKRAGLTLRYDMRPPNDGEIGCLGSLARLYRHGGAAVLDEVLGILRGAWGNRASAYRANLVEGVFGLVWRYHDTYQRERLVKVMRQGGRTPEDVYREAEKLGTRDFAMHIAQLLHGWYNSDLRTTPRLEDFVVGKSERSLWSKLSKQWAKRVREQAARERGS
jgi:hypothetical protein